MQCQVTQDLRIEPITNTAKRVSQHEKISLHALTCSQKSLWSSLMEDACETKKRRKKKGNAWQCLDNLHALIKRKSQNQLPPRQYSGAFLNVCLPLLAIAELMHWELIFSRRPIRTASDSTSLSICFLVSFYTPLCPFPPPAWHPSFSSLTHPRFTGLCQNILTFERI